MEGQIKAHPKVRKKGHSKFRKKGAQQGAESGTQATCGVRGSATNSGGGRAIRSKVMVRSKGHSQMRSKGAKKVEKYRAEQGGENPPVKAERTMT